MQEYVIPSELFWAHNYSQYTIGPKYSYKLLVKKPVCGVADENGLKVANYANMPMHYAEIFKSCETDNFQMKKFDRFLIFAQDIDCGYTLELPQSMF